MSFDPFRNPGGSKNEGPEDVKEEVKEGKGWLGVYGMEGR